MRNDTTCTGRVKSLEHHIFDGTWIARPSKPHPTMSVQLTFLPEDIAALGFHIKDRSTHNNHYGGCSSCQSFIIPLCLALAMGITQTYQSSSLCAAQLKKILMRRMASLLEPVHRMPLEPTGQLNS